MTTLPSGRYHLVPLFSCFSTLTLTLLILIVCHCSQIFPCFITIYLIQKCFYLFICIILSHTQPHILSHRLPCSFTREAEFLSRLLSLNRRLLKMPSCDLLTVFLYTSSSSFSPHLSLGVIYIHSIIHSLHGEP